MVFINNINYYKQRFLAELTTTWESLRSKRPKPLHQRIPTLEDGFISFSIFTLHLFQSMPDSKLSRITESSSQHRRHCFFLAVLNHQIIKVSSTTYICTVNCWIPIYWSPTLTVLNCGLGSDQHSKKIPGDLSDPVSSMRDT